MSDKGERLVFWILVFATIAVIAQLSRLVIEILQHFKVI